MNVSVCWLGGGEGSMINGRYQCCLDPICVMQDLSRRSINCYEEDKFEILRVAEIPEGAVIIASMLC